MSDAKPQPRPYMPPPPPEPWSPAEATRRLNAMAKVASGFDVSFKLHALEQMKERDITTVDAIHVMKTGFVLEAPVAAKQPGLYRYKVKGLTPSSNRREVAIVVIPSMHQANAKIVTVMWTDEPVMKG